MPEPVITAVVALIAALASVVAIARGVDELTSGKRLRDMEVLLRANLDGAAAADGGGAVLQSFHRGVIARLVARDAVPGRLFVGPVAQVLMYPLGVGVVAVLLPPSEWMGFLVVVIVSMGVLAIELRTLFHLARERRRVARCLERGLSPVRAFTSIEGTWPQWGRGVYWMLGALVVGPVLAATGMGLIINRTREISDVLGIVLTAVGVALVRGGLSAVRRSVARDGVDEPTLGAPTWVYPSATPEAPFGDLTGHNGAQTSRGDD